MLKTKEVLYRGKVRTYDELKPHSMIPLTVICDECEREYTSTKYQLERNGHQMCRSCALWATLGQALQIGEKFGRLKVISKSEKHGYSICECECGNIKEYKNTYLRREQILSCGCLQKEKARENALNLCKIQYGENHPNWKGGITKDRNIKESSKEYKDIRTKLLDNGKCECCGCQDNLRTHHIIPYCVAPEKFVDETNMVVLCEDCHRKYHHKYGFKGNVQMFNEFIDNHIIKGGVANECMV